MSQLSYQEKRLYAQLAAALIIYVPYFAFIVNGHASTGHLTGIVFFFTITQIIFQTIIALTSRDRVTDERDSLIEARGFRAAYFTLVVGIIMIFVLLRVDHVFNSILMVNVLFAALVVAELSKVITQLVSYRKAL